MTLRLWQTVMLFAIALQFSDTSASNDNQDGESSDPKRLLL